MKAFDQDAGAPRIGITARFGESAPFLDQGRAQNTLRHELQKLFEAVEARLDDAGARATDAIVELSSRPNRIIARHDAGAITFSWLTGRLGGVSDGHLLVIEWAGVPADHRGISALKTATPARETSYRPEAR